MHDNLSTFVGGIKDDNTVENTTGQDNASPAMTAADDTAETTPQTQGTVGAVGAAGKRRAPAVLFEDGTPGLVMQTETRVDTGGWTGKPRLWLALCGEKLLVAADGRRPYLEQAARAGLGESCYCHVTGVLLLAPAHGMRARSLRIPPLEGRRVLQWIQEKDRHHA